MAKKRKVPKRRGGPKRGPKHGAKLNPIGSDVPIIQSIEAQRDDEGGLDEGAGFDAALKMHPDMYQMTMDGKMLPEEIRDEAGNAWSPRLHVAMHAAVENQLAIDEPAGIAALALKLEGEQLLGAHEVRHAMMDALSVQVFEAQKNDRAFDEDQYMTDIPKRYQTFVDAKR